MSEWYSADRRWASWLTVRPTRAEVRAVQDDRITAIMTDPRLDDDVRDLLAGAERLCREVLLTAAAPDHVVPVAPAPRRRRARLVPSARLRGAVRMPLLGVA